MRLFVALELPWSLRPRLSDLAMGLTGVRWVPPETYHVTLRFIGEVNRLQAEEIDLALAGMRGRAFALELAGVGTQERDGRVTALWAGVTRNAALEHLRGKVDTALRRAGVPAERRRFAPHVTLARLGGLEPGLAGWVQSHNLFRAGPVEVTHMTLFSSVPGGDAACYTAEMEYGLA